MRWILPLLTLAIVAPAHAERAVYTGSLKVQNLANPTAPSVVRVAEVIDLETGKLVTVALTGTKLNFSFNVGSEVESVIAKATDAKKRSTTAFAQAAAAVDSNGSKFALSTVLRGLDVTVTLGDAGPSRWPRSLSGSGSLVAGAGSDAASAPGGISLSTIGLTLSEPYSKLANSSGGTLEQCAEVVGQAYRDAVAKSLKYPVSNGTASTGTVNPASGSVAVQNSLGGTLNLFPSFGFRLFTNPTTNIAFGPDGYYSSGSAVKTGAGTLTLTPPVHLPTPVSGTSGGSVTFGGSVTTGYSGGSIDFGTSGVTHIGVGTVTTATPINGTLTTAGGVVLLKAPIDSVLGSGMTMAGNVTSNLPIANAGTMTGSITLTGATNLTTSGASSLDFNSAAGWTAVNPTTGASIVIGSPEFSALLATGTFVGSSATRIFTYQPFGTIPISTTPPVVDPAHDVHVTTVE